MLFRSKASPSRVGADISKLCFSAIRLKVYFLKRKRRENFLSFSQCNNDGNNSKDYCYDDGNDSYVGGCGYLTGE